MLGMDAVTANISAVLLFPNFPIVVFSGGAAAVLSK